MTNLPYILAAILMLGIMITAHEAGHFFASRACGIAVKEFAIGMGPKILSRVSAKSGTRFSLRAIPLGGYCMFYGEDDVDGSEQEDPRAYPKQKVWKRMISVVSGPLMNFVLALVVAVFLFAAFGMHLSGAAVQSVDAGSPAAAAGMLAGDEIALVAGEDVRALPLGEVSALLAKGMAGGAAVDVTLLRGGTDVPLTITPAWDGEAKAYRVGISMISAHAERLSFGAAIPEAVSYCVEAGGLILKGLKAIFTTSEGLEGAAGPVGIIQVISEETQAGGLSAYLSLLVMISINLGLVNLLPIPGLDGSRFLFMLAEAIRRKPVSQKKEALVHTAGFVLLLGLMLFFTFKDVVRLFS